MTRRKRVLIVTDTWHPQVNGVLRSLLEMSRVGEAAGVDFSFLHYGGLRTIGLPNYPEIRLAVARASEISRRIESADADAIHIATEGPIGMHARNYCVKNGRAFTTSFHTRLPEYLSLRFPFPECWTWAWLRRFHRPSRCTMAATRALANELEARGFRNVAVSPFGVDTQLFSPEMKINLDLPRPIFLSVGRVAVEKNLDAFLSLDLPGTKVVVGDGPARGGLEVRYPKVVFLGRKTGSDLARVYASADVFVFPSRTDTFGLVILEALACGVPVAAFPVSGPKDVIGDKPLGVLDTDLKKACISALSVSRQTCREFAEGMSWETSFKVFMAHVEDAAAAVEADGSSTTRAA